MKYSYKKLISLFFVAVLCVSLAGSAFAEPAVVTRAKAFIAATMLASNLVLEPVGAVFNNALAQAVDPLNIVSTITDSSWTNYLDQSVIQVRRDVVTVDGVPYSQILLGPDAANSLRAAGLDFATAYNILNDQSLAISYAEGAGTVDGSPYYLIDGEYRTPYYNVSGVGTYNIGNSVVFNQSSGTYKGNAEFSTGESTRNTSFQFVQAYKQVLGNTGRGTPRLYVKRSNGGWQYANGPTSLVNYSPFSFDYTSGIIDAPLAEDDWLVIQVPTQYNDPVSGNTYNINNIINNYPEVADGKEINVDPTLNPDFQTDIDLGNDLGDLINTILNLLDLLKTGNGFKVEFNKNVEPHPEPEPAPVPDPDIIPDIDPTPLSPENPGEIGITNWDFLDKLLRWIQSTINNFRVSVSNALHNIQETINDIFDSIHNIEDSFMDIIESLGNLPEIFERHVIDTFRKALDVLKNLFAPIFLLLKNALGIWHYVVEWLSSISAPFSWILGRFQSAGVGIMLPIYASIAGGIVIAVYKRFGR